MLLMVVKMLKKKLGVEAIDREWRYLGSYFKIPSTLIIPDGVKRIGSYAFWCCRNLKKAVIPGSVELIDDCSFVGSTLVRIVIPEGCKRIGAKVFEFCNKLEEVVISKSVEWIENYAFYKCEKATIILKKPRKTFKYIGHQVFKGCKDVKEETGT